MGKGLRVELLSNWAQQPNRGPAAFYRTDSADPGVLQVSIKAEYKGGAIPNPTHQDLIALARGHGERYRAGAETETLSGSCSLGTYGSVVFRSEKFPRVQFWYLSNGRDFVFATHVCTKEPETAECIEVQKIVETVKLSE